MVRIPVFTDDAEREAQAALLRTPEELAAFFAEIDARHSEVPGEDDWEVHRARIERSRRHGLDPDGELG